MEDNKTTKQKFGDIFETLLAAIGVILFWRGVWDISMEFMDPWMSIVLGLLILSLIAIVERKRIFRDIV